MKNNRLTSFLKIAEIKRTRQFKKMKEAKREQTEMDSASALGTNRGNPSTPQNNREFDSNLEKSGIFAQALVEDVFNDVMNLDTEENYRNAIILISRFRDLENNLIKSKQEIFNQIDGIDKYSRQELNTELKELKKSLHTKTKSIKELENEFEKLIQENDKNEQILKQKQVEVRTRKAEMLEKVYISINDFIIILSKLNCIYKNDTKESIRETIFEQMDQIKAEFEQLLHLTESHLNANEFIDDITEEKQDLFLSLIKSKETLAERQQDFEDSLEIKNELEKQCEQILEENESIIKNNFEEINKNEKSKIDSNITDLTIKKLELEQEINEKSKFQNVFTMPINEILKYKNDYNKDYAEKVEEYIQLLIEREEIHKNQKKEYSKDILDFEYSSLVLEKNTLPIQVYGASLEELASLLLKQYNEDPMFIKALCILLINIEADLVQFFEFISKKYDITSRNKIFKDQRISSFMWQYKEYQDVKFAEITKRFAYLERPKFNPQFLHMNYVDSIEYHPSKELIYSADSDTLAEHLSAYELTLIRNIPVTELKAAEWTSKAKNEKAPSIMKLINHFNRIGEYLLTSFYQKQTKEERVNLLKQWINLYIAAEKINNFTLIFALSGTFNHKLLGNAEEWKEIPESMMTDYKRIDLYSSPLKKFKNYNDKIAQLQEEKVIPYIGTNLTNLVFIQDGNPLMIKSPKTGDDLYNFKKQRAIAEQISLIKKHWGRQIQFSLSKDLYERIDEELSNPQFTEDEIVAIYEKYTNSLLVNN